MITCVRATVFLSLYQRVNWNATVETDLLMVVIKTAPPSSMCHASEQDPAAVNKVLKQRFEDSEPPRRFSYTHNAQEPPVACATTPFTSSTNRPSSEPVGRPVECQASKKRKTPGGNLQCPSASVESDGGPPKQKRGGGRREGQCGRRGWLPEEDERLRQVSTPVPFFGYCKRYQGTVW